MLTLALTASGKWRNIPIKILRYLIGKVVWLPLKVEALFQKIFFIGIGIFGLPALTELVLKANQKYLPLTGQFIVLGLLFSVLFISLSYMTRDGFFKQEAKLNARDVYMPLILTLAYSLIMINCFAALTSTFYHAGSLKLEPEPKAEGFTTFVNFYFWELLNLVPQLQLPETLHWQAPFTYQDVITSRLVIVFKAIMAFSVIKLVFKWVDWQKKKEHTEGNVLINGDRIYYEKAGSGSTVVLLHGMALDCRMWNAQFYTLAKFFTVIRFDLRGFGKSTRPGELNEYSHHHDLLCLLERLEIDRVNLVGFEMGARVALDFAIAYPDKTNSVTLVSPQLNGYIPTFDASANCFDIAVNWGKKMANYRWLKMHLKKFPEEKKPDLHKNNMLEDLCKIVSSYSGWHWVEGKERLSIEPLSLGSLSSITMPLIVFYGEKDRKEIQELASLITENVPVDNVIKFSIPETGHFPCMEEPTVFNELLLRALSFIHFQKENKSYSAIY